MDERIHGLGRETIRDDAVRVERGSVSTDRQGGGRGFDLRGREECR